MLKGKPDFPEMPHSPGRILSVPGNTEQQLPTQAPAALTCAWGTPTSTFKATGVRPVSALPEPQVSGQRSDLWTRAPYLSH